MAKKSSSNAINKIDEQLKELEKTTTIKVEDEKTPVIGKKELQEEIKKVTTKTPAKKTTTKKSTAKKTSSSTTKKSTTKKTNSTTKSKTSNTVKKTTTPKKSTTKKTSAAKKTTTKKATAKKSTTKKAIPKKEAIVVSESVNNKIDEIPIVVDDKKNQLEITKKFEFKELEEKKEKKKINRRKDKFKFEDADDIEEKTSTAKLNRLETEMRSLYDKVNDVVDDITYVKEVNNVQDILISDVVESKDETSDKLDDISNRLLRNLTIALLIIFLLLLIFVLGIIIYVCTY